MAGRRAGVQEASLDGGRRGQGRRNRVLQGVRPRGRQGRAAGDTRYHLQHLLDLQAVHVHRPDAARRASQGRTRR